MLFEKQELKHFTTFMKTWRKVDRHKIEEPPKRVFSTTIIPSAMKLGTHMQGTGTNTQAKFQGHSPIITPFPPHMCSIQGHWHKNVNTATYPYDYFRM